MTDINTNNTIQSATATVQNRPEDLAERLRQQASRPAETDDVSVSVAAQQQLAADQRVNEVTGADSAATRPASALQTRIDDLLGTAPAERETEAPLEAEAPVTAQRQPEPPQRESEAPSPATDPARTDNDSDPTAV